MRQANVDDTEFTEIVGQLLKSQSTMGLATTAEDHSPHIAPLFYFSSDDLRLCWFSSPSSGHSKNLARNSAAAVTVYRPTEQWKGICGVQMRGIASIVRDPEQRQLIEKAYVDRFHLGAQFQSEISRSDLYEFHPHWVRYIDNSKGFGYKVERSLA